MSEIFQPTMDAIPPAVRGKRAAAEIYHEVLVHRWNRSEATGGDVRMRDAVASYVREVLPEVADEREPVPLEPPAA